jgi:predicted DNA-binding antitoxin AbrB/MazE fold protein
LNYPGPLLPGTIPATLVATSEDAIVTLTVEAVYENGQLKFKEPVRLAEGTAVRVTITPISEGDDPLAGFIGSLATGRTDGAEHHDRYISKKRRP